MSKMDPGSNYTIASVLTDADLDAGTVVTTGIDHKNGQSVTYIGTVLIAATTLTATLQYSDDDSTYAAEPNTDAGNTVSASLDASTGDFLIHCPNPRARYTRLSVVSTGDNAALNVVAVKGPLLNA